LPEYKVRGFAFEASNKIKKCAQYLGIKATKVLSHLKILPTKVLEKLV